MIIVTGGAGFIGSHLCEALLSRGEKVTCVDNFNDYYDPKIKKKNIQVCLKNKNFKLLKADITEIMLPKADCIVHLAARAGIRPSLVDPFLYYDVNVKGTINVLKSALKSDARVVFGSSSSVYGKSTEIPYSEETLGIPISPYAASKLGAEHLCRSYAEEHKMNIACLRFFTVYGPRNRPDMAVHKFTKKIMRGEEIEMFGDGSSKRDYTYIADIVQGIVGAVERNKGFEIFNLGNNQTVELKKLIRVIEESVGKKAKINRKPLQAGDVDITYANIDKAKKLLGYNPKTKIEKGISEFVKWSGVNSSKYLVTGGAGFIGKYLVDELLRKGEEVIVLDNFSSGKYKPKTKIIKGSVTDKKKVQQATKGVDYVINLAALLNVPESFEKPEEYFDVNALGTLNLLEACRENKVKKFVLVSSAAVYGNIKPPAKEDVLLKPISPYAGSKALAEHYCEVYNHLYGIPTVCLRYFNVYGHGQDPNSSYAGVISKFAEKISKNKSPSIFGDGKQTRDYVFVKDVVEATILACEKKWKGNINVATGKETTLNELFRTLLKISNKKLKATYRSERPGDIKNSCADVSKAKNLGFKAKTPLEKGLSELF